MTPTEVEAAHRHTLATYRNRRTRIVLADLRYATTEADADAEDTAARIIRQAYPALAVTLGDDR